MGYYMSAAGDYYSAARGDYYSAAGDFWSKAKKKLSKVAKNPLVQGAALTLLPGGLATGAVGQLAKGFLASKSGGSVRTSPTAVASSFLPAAAGQVLKQVGLAATGGIAAAATDALLDFGGGRGKRRRTMNPANVAALRRALRRVDSFRHLAKKSGAMPAARRLPPQRGGHCHTCK